MMTIITADIAAKVLTVVDAAAAAYAAAAAADDARDKSLATYAENIVQVLIEMKAPGCQWLVLAPIEAVS